jgi:integrase
MQTNIEVGFGANHSLDAFAEMYWGISNLAPKTVQNYRNAYRRNVGTYVGSKGLSQVTIIDLLQIMAPLSPQTYFQTLMSARAIFRYATSLGLLTEDPTLGIKPKKIKVSPGKFLTWDEIKSTDFGKYDSQIKFLALHGLRWGEAIVLTQEDIRYNKIYITKSKAGPTKTSAGNRAVPYFGYFKTFPKSRHAIANKLKEFGVTIHSLRKTYAYFLKSNQVHVTAAAKFLGHSNPLVTLKIYTLVRDEEIDDIGNALRKVI